MGRTECAIPLVVSALLAGCGTTYGGAHSGTCRYHLQHTSTGTHCRSRPQPSDAVRAEAMSGRPMRLGLAVWKRTGGSRQVGSVGINQWAETSFAIDNDHVTTVNAAGKRTSGDDGYAFKPDQPFDVSVAKPKVLARAIEAVRAHQPSSYMVGAVLTVAPFSNELAWNFSMVSKKTSSEITYQVYPDGTGLCHGNDPVKDALVPAPGIPLCPNSILPRYDVAQRSP